MLAGWLALALMLVINFSLCGVVISSLRRCGAARDAAVAVCDVVSVSLVLMMM